MSGLEEVSQAIRWGLRLIAESCSFSLLNVTDYYVVRPWQIGRILLTSNRWVRVQPRHWTSVRRHRRLRAASREFGTIWGWYDSNSLWHHVVRFMLTWLAADQHRLLFAVLCLQPREVAVQPRPGLHLGLPSTSLLPQWKISHRWWPHH